MLDALHRGFPEVRIILLGSLAIKKDRVIYALAKGAVGFLEISSCERYLAKAVRCINQGEAWVSRNMLAKIVELVKN